MSELSELLQAAQQRNPMTLRQREAKADGAIQFGTIGTYLRGHHPANPEESTLRALSRAFDVPLERLQMAAGVTVGGADWTPPMEVSRLTKRQQNALTELIRAIAAGGSSDDRQSEAQKSPSPEDGVNSERQAVDGEEGASLLADTAPEIAKAARTTWTSKGVHIREQDEAGEENQDTGEWHEA